MAVPQQAVLFLGNVRRIGQPLRIRPTAREIAAPLRNGHNRSLRGVPTIVQRKESDDKGKNPLDRPCFLWYNVHKNDFKELMTHEMSLLRIPGKQGGGFPPF